MPKKTDRFSFRLAPSELAMLREMSKAEGESDAFVLRRLIREAHEKRTPSKKK
jgi:hypothetical protein